MVNDRILIAREQRNYKVQQLSKEHDVITVKANVPGWNKNIPQAKLVVNFFVNKIKNLGAYNLTFYDSADGLTVFAITDNGLDFKKNAVELESSHELGRFVDIDVTLKGENKSLNRAQMRKCFLCDKPAFVCGRDKTHTTAQLLNYFIDTIDMFFIKNITDIIENSMVAELNLENKFGLVTPTSNGSHNDLSYKIMLSAIYAIKNQLVNAFYLGLTNEKQEDLVEKLKALGLVCENQMYAATNGANAYKGFIFVGGIILAAVGMSIKNGDGVENLRQTSAELCEKFTYPTDTFGAKAHKEGFGGIRECAKDGFEIVHLAERLINKRSLDEILTYIIGNIDDSVLYKRAKSVERYNYFKNLISNAPNDSNIREKITKECIQNNISIGGGADILIAAVMLNKLKKIFYL